jgi:hypothetical protein
MVAPVDRKLILTLDDAVKARSFFHEEPDCLQVGDAAAAVKGAQVVVEGSVQCGHQVGATTQWSSICQEYVGPGMFGRAYRARVWWGRRDHRNCARADRNGGREELLPDATWQARARWLTDRGHGMVCGL